jgi:acetylornithine deacetylase/succinyl-diaminopimelate desuccinylase-like protein
MLKVSDLLDSGYIKYENSLNQDYKPNYLGSYQKFIRDNQGKKYSINISHWDMSSITKKENDEKFDASSQFNTIAGERTFNMDLHIRDNMSLEDVEEFFETAWRSMKADYYERY